MHSSTLRRSASIFVIATKRPALVRRTPSFHRARDQRDDYLCVVSMLTRSNYNEWALFMRVNLQAQGFWHTVETEEGKVIEYWRIDCRSQPYCGLCLWRCWCLSPPNTPCNRPRRGSNPTGLVCSDCGSPTSSSYGRSSRRSSSRTVNPSIIFPCG